MSGTGQFPSIQAEPETFTADPTRWPRIRSAAAVLAVIAAGGGAGWWWTGEPVGALVAAVCLIVLVCAVLVVPWVVVRLDASDRRHAVADRDRERLALDVQLVRTRQDTDHARLSVLRQRVEEQHLEHLECRSERRNQVIDMNRAKSRRT